MESRASDGGDSDGIDSLYADTPPARKPPVVDKIQTPALDDSIFDFDNSASDVSMSTASDEEEGIRVTPAVQPVPRALDSELLEHPQASLADKNFKKRKHDSWDKPSEQHNPNDSRETHRKRRKSEDVHHAQQNPVGKLPQDKSLLPAEIWHHIFTFCSPRALGSLLKVNKAFSSYLDAPASAPVTNTSPKFTLHLLVPDMIWKASRLLMDLSKMPAPLSQTSELEMWRLSCGSLCQYCSKERQLSPVAHMDQWHAGPGENGISPVWAFGIRTCGSCLQSHATKEIDLLLSSFIPSPLMAALPFVFVTNELHVVSSSALQSGQQPPHIQITKYFSNDHIQAIKQDFEDVKAMGSATAEEWLKGLEGKGKERRNDAARWERWEATGGLARMRATERAESASLDAQKLRNGSLANNPATNGNPPSYPTPNLQQLQHLAAALKAKQVTNQPLPVPNNLIKAPAFNLPTQNGFTPFPPRLQAPTRHERTKEEVAELKLARRIEIERRCSELEPRITPGVLAHMASFQAAIQIIQPLTDSAWEVLKPRLLSQREEAEQRESDRLAQARIIQQQINQMQSQNKQMDPDPMALGDSQWDDLQAPLRARIGGYADEIIRDGWNDGKKVNYENAPLFAAEVFIYVRKRFYAEIAKDEAAVRATGKEPQMDPPDGPYTRILILENMKWIFETKIKPHTEPFRKELFICNACEYANKYYGFEGVIQHFAAKHTSALSLGSIVVHWKSEWPEQPPFNPDPTSVPLNAFYPNVPGTNISHPGAGPPTPEAYGYGRYPPTSMSSNIHPPQQHRYQESQPSYYVASPLGQYPGPHNGHYAPVPAGYSVNTQGYQNSQYSSAVPGANAYPDASQNYTQQGYNGQSQFPAQGTYAPTHAYASYPGNGMDSTSQHSAHAPANAPSVAQHQAGTYHQPPMRTEEYLTQLQHVARNARDTWNSIGNVKEVPGSVKVFTVLYHVLKSYRTTFNDTLPLSMVVDGLSNNKDMRPVRNVNGLLCRACSLQMAGFDSSLPKKHFSFPQLVNHFYSVHEQGISGSAVSYVPDWTQDMVELPDTAKLRSIATVPGVDNKKLAIFTEAVPEIVQKTRKSREAYPNTRRPLYKEHQESEYEPQLAPSEDHHEKYYGLHRNGRISEAGTISYRSGEYDPRNPGEVLTLSEPRNEVQRNIISAQGRPRSDHNSSWYSQHTGHVTADNHATRTHSHSELEPNPHNAVPRESYHRFREELPVYSDRPVRYLESDAVEHRIRGEPPIAYETCTPTGRDYEALNSRAYSSNQERISKIEPSARSTQLRAIENSEAQQNRVYDVAAQISQQAQNAEQARERKPVEHEPMDVGSEDGELQMATDAGVQRKRNPISAQNNTTEFLADNPRSELYGRSASRIDQDSHAQVARGSSVRYVQDEYEPSRQIYADGVQMNAGSRRIVRPMDEIPYDRYLVQERHAPRPTRMYIEDFVQRERSPELVDRRFKLNNAVYVEERPNSQGAYHRSSRYARYASVRLENDRAMSRSPQVDKGGQQINQYRERSANIHPQSHYRERTPPSGGEIVYEETAPRQDYHRVYLDEPRAREPRYEEAYELVRVSDPQGDYMIRRPLRREPVYATYDDEVYTRQPVYEARPPAATAEAPFVEEEEEYDPRHPEPPPIPVRQERYQ